MDFLKFDQLITPKILSIVYLLLVIFCIVMAVKTGGTNGMQMIGWIIAAIVMRVPFEFVMVTFKNNEYLRRICEEIEAKKAE
ncbi:TPA_asm: DUF4282 domain-containing protein [Salmonella enterica subsp. salamae serovar 42:z:1,5]|uniref:DUF4282 domain-containing protein n=1 Tax=Salmonella enterica subsp. salamae serovar 42:z:1,5 TaxID=1967617 RepID=A0A735Q0P4_SALER|nr:hypothetical protein [Salmonella enterica]EBR9915371.1 hypothetical protein [Salmonella enterica subsp. enterica serovar Richmond]EBZ2052248.1 hypothetical protein [Salmonella enterica subsp. enterica serovar Weltevreden]ECC8829918.1 hypothetical protein [Salmonella enterica subsp. salamae]ECC9721208.1 hypothetical protein [Salmonella enterica subsp. diarizonae]ECD2896546.1 hypothetical protein [Salmonella enterica subsp. enterica serovar Goverdhan]ECS7950348.1 hypothetical protein [Salmon